VSYQRQECLIKDKRWLELSDHVRARHTSGNLTSYLIFVPISLQGRIIAVVVHDSGDFTGGLSSVLAPYGSTITYLGAYIFFNFFCAGTDILIYI